MSLGTFGLRMYRGRGAAHNMHMHMGTVLCALPKLHDMRMSCP